KQSLIYTKPVSFLIFIIHKNLFESDQSEALHQFIHKYAHIVGIIQLPDTAFASKQHKKSIFMLQKRGEHTENVKEPLLAVLPSFNNTAGMEDILGKINQWFEQSFVYLSK